MSRLIFIEGFPGAGKSTTAQFLARRLARRGGRVRWVYEGEVPNPLVPTPPSDGYQSWEQFAERRVERWRAFAAAAAAEHDVTIVPESALLQLPVFTMLRRNVEPALITALVSRLVEAAAPLRPSLVYLARRDPEGAFRAIGEQRGLPWLLQHMAEAAVISSSRRAVSPGSMGFSPTGAPTPTCAARPSSESTCRSSCSRLERTAG